VNYLDANFLTAVYFNVPGQTAVAEKFLRKNSSPFLFSELAELECSRAFVLQAGKADSENWIRLQAAIASGVWLREPLEWGPVRDRYHELLDRFGVRLKAGTLDTLHVAHALHSGSTRFLSFDSASNARVLAVSCRLAVYPDLTSGEKARVIRSR